MKKNYTSGWVILLLIFFSIELGYSQQKDTSIHSTFKPNVKEKLIEGTHTAGFKRLQRLRDKVRSNIQNTTKGKQHLHTYSRSGRYSYALQGKVITDKQTSLPIYIESHLDELQDLKLSSRASVSQVTQQYLRKISQQLPQEVPEDEFIMSRFHTDKLGYTHVNMQQQYHGIPVLGSEMLIHVRPDGNITMNGRFTYTPQISSIEPKLTPEEAIHITQDDIELRVKVLEFHEQHREILEYEGPETRLIIYSNPQQPDYHRLAYEVEVRPNVKDHYFYYVDAKNGNILDRINHTCTLLPPVLASGFDLNNEQQEVVVFQAGNNQFFLVDNTQNMFRGQTNSPRNGDGLIITFDHEDDINSRQIGPVTSTNNQWNPTAISAHRNAIICYNYFENTFNRVSIDGNGRDVQSFINVPDEDNLPMDNAYWNGVGIYYGNGDRAFSPLAGALDVAAHEMTHGVIFATANLTYQGESGALNESFADVFGVLIERENFLIGEDVVNTQIFRSGALRNLADPHNGGSRLGDPGFQPRHVDEQFMGTDDNGGVHINSGIPNRAFAIILDRLGLDQTALQKTENIYYRALTEYLFSSAQFVDARLAIEQAARDLYGDQEVEIVREAFDLVGILAPDQGGNQETDPFKDVEVNPGKELMIVINTESSDPNKIYIYDEAAPQFEQFIPISRQDPKRPVRVSDDGSRGVFVNSENELILLEDLDTGNPTERFLENNSVWSDTLWDNAAISKDGNRIAAVSIFQDTAIYVYDLESRRGGGFMLYNPTTAEGVRAGEVVFADALEWDFSGEFIMYDAFNLVSEDIGFFDLFGGGDNSAESYFDIGFIRVWDNEINNFSDGTVFKLFSSIPEGVSIGNPVFSKNSPYIIAFDQLKENNLEDITDDEFDILIRNIETGEMNIFENTTIGFPSFSADDTRLAFNVFDQENGEAVSYIQLAEDKVTPQGDIQPLLFEARFPTWYSNGVRNLSVDIHEHIAEGSIRVYPNPFKERINIEYTLNRQEEVDIGLHNLMGQEVYSQLLDGRQQQGKQVLEFGMEGLNRGVYLLSITVNGASYRQKIVKQ